MVFNGNCSLQEKRRDLEFFVEVSYKKLSQFYTAIVISKYGMNAVSYVYIAYIMHLVAAPFFVEDYVCSFHFNNFTS